MFGYVIASAPGAADRVFAAAAAHLHRDGRSLAGAVQIDSEREGRRPHMDLHLLGTANIVRISQDLGPGARGCRLDPAGLEQAAALVERSLSPAPHLLIVNKFGKQELDGRGFRPVIGRALSENIPTLTAVSPAHLDGFRDFAQDLATLLPLDPEAILAWRRRAANPQ